jgi:periplasmic divalent cation tolerance protein
MNDISILVSTFPTIDSARNAVRTLVQERLVACGNMMPGIESIYRWQDAIESSTEVMVIFKTTTSVAGQAQERLRELHPYDVPEILQISVDGAWPAYLGWVRAQTGKVSE